MKKLVIIGASGHGKVIADIAIHLGYDNIIFLDDNPDLKMVGDFTVVGNCSKINYYIDREYDFVVGIGNAYIRERILTELSAKKCKIVSLKHPMSNMAFNVKVGLGTIVMPGATINEGTVIGKGCIVNTKATIAGNAIIEDFAHVSVGAMIGRNTKIGDKTWIGIGAKVLDNVNICSECMIGAGAKVDKDIKFSGKYVGVPIRAL